MERMAVDLIITGPSDPALKFPELNGTDFAHLDTSVIIPDYNLLLAKAADSKEHLELLRPVVKKVLAEIFQSRSQRLIVFLTSTSAQSQYLLLLQIRKVFPEIIILVASPLNDPKIEAFFSEGICQLYFQVTNSDHLFQFLTKLPQDLNRYRSNPELLKADLRNSMAPPQVQRSAAKVLLLLMPAWDKSSPPLGLAQISAALKQVNIETDIVDLNHGFWKSYSGEMNESSFYETYDLWSHSDRYQKQARPHLGKVFERLEQIIRANDYEYFGFSIFDTSREASVEAFSVIRRLSPKAKVFCGGPSCLPEWAETMLLENKIDAAVFGEGELSAVELLQSWEKKETRAIAGTFQRGTGAEILKGVERGLANFEDLPFPDFSHFKLVEYADPTLPITFSRGCVAKCTFCPEAKYWREFRSLPADRVLASIKKAILEPGLRVSECVIRS